MFLLLLLLLLLLLFTGYERDPVTIALAYLSSFTFLVDVAALVPLEILAASVVANKLNWAVAFKINRLLKLWKVG